MKEEFEIYEISTEKYLYLSSSKCDLINAIGFPVGIINYDNNNLRIRRSLDADKIEILLLKNGEDILKELGFTKKEDSK